MLKARQAIQALKEYNPPLGDRSGLRLDFNEWRLKGLLKKEALMRKLSGMVPLRVKAAAALGALRAGGAEAIEIVKEDFHLDGTNKG